MRIIHIIDYFQPQLGYQETFLCREQAKMGHEVYMVTSDRYSPDIYEPNRNLLGSRIKADGFFEEQGIKVWRLKRLFEIPHGIWMIGLERKIRELKPDLVIIHGIVNFQAIQVAYLKRKLRACKLIYDDHGTPFNSRNSMGFLYKIFKLSFANVIKKHADIFVAVSEATRQFMHSRYGIPLEKISVIPLGADDTLFRFDPIARKGMRKQLAINENDVIFIYTGKITPIKSLEVLIEAMKLLSKATNIKVLLVGSGIKAYIEQLQEMIKARDLQERFIWHEAVPNEELYKLYSAADAAVWPCASSIGQREALACGLPLIIGENSLVTDLVSYGNGFVFREGDAAHLAEKMNILLEPRLRHQMGLNSRKAVEEHLNWRIIAKQFYELVEK